MINSATHETALHIKLCFTVEESGVALRLKRKLEKQNSGLIRDEKGQMRTDELREDTTKRQCIFFKQLR